MHAATLIETCKKKLKTKNYKQISDVDKIHHWGAKYILKTLQMWETQKRWRQPHILKKSRTSGEMGDAPDKITRTRPPSAAFTLLKTSRSQMGDGVFPGSKEKKNDE